MEWTLRRTALLLLVATGTELLLALAISVVDRLSFLQALAPVLLLTGASWTIVGMAVSGSGRIAPPLSTAGIYGYAQGVQPSLSSELYISRAGAERVARESMEWLTAGSAFMIPAVLYGLALFLLGLWLVV